MNRAIGLTVIACLASASVPAFANPRTAAFAHSGDIHSARSSMFAGATYRVGFHRRSGKAKGMASFKLAGMATAPGSAEVRFGHGLELTGSGTGKPAFHIAGQEIAQIKRRASLSTGGAIAIGVGVVVLVGAAILVSTKPWECYSDGAPCD